ncbi:TIGR04076 family protein [Chloroflexota bacterium]
MAESYNVSIKLIGNQKPCHNGHKVGDEWLWDDKTPGGLCWAAYNAIFPFALVLKFGGQFPWQDNPDVVTASCPDSEVVNRFEIRRIPEK